MPRRCRAWAAVLCALLPVLGRAAEGQVPAGADPPPHVQAWTASRMGAGEAVADPAWLRLLVLRGPGADPAAARAARVAIDGMIRLGLPADRAVLDAAWEAGARIEAVLLASPTPDGAVWALDRALALPRRIVRSEAVLLALAATAPDRLRVGRLWPDQEPTLHIIVGDRADPGAGGPIGMFGSRSGGGRARGAPGESWPPEFRYDLCTPQSDGAIALPSPTRPYACRRVPATQPRAGDDASDGHEIRLSLVVARAMQDTGRGVATPDLTAVERLTWDVTGDLAAAIASVVDGHAWRWAQAAALVRDAGLRPELVAPKVRVAALVDAREDSSRPLPVLPGMPAWESRRVGR